MPFLRYSHVYLLLGFLLGCVDSTDKSGDMTPEPTLTVCSQPGQVQGCVCSDGRMGEQMCSDDTVWGPCFGCDGDDVVFGDTPPSDVRFDGPDSAPTGGQVSSMAPVDGCYVCLDESPWVKRCDEADSTQECSDTETTQSCVNPSSCCPMNSQFEGQMCSCSPLYGGPDCSVCADPRGDIERGCMVDETVPTVTIATFNVRRLFDDRCDSGVCGSDEYEDLLSTSEFEARGLQIARALDALNVDVILLQEVENQRCIDAIMAGFPDGKYPTAVIKTRGSGGGMEVAVLGRGDLISTQSHRNRLRHTFDNGETAGFAREFLEVQMTIRGHKVVVFSAHFIARSSGRDRFWRDPYRRAEAGKAREIVLEATRKNPQALVVLGGDLNDTPGSAPLTALEGSGGLKRVAEELGRADRTHSFGALDHIYLSESSSGAFIPGTSEVVRSGQRGYIGSDHAVLKATFTLE